MNSRRLIEYPHSPPSSQSDTEVQARPYAICVTSIAGPHGGMQLYER